MADEFKIVASLDIPKSAKAISDDIPKLQGQVKQLKIIADLDPKLSIKNIQATLNKMNNNANIKIGIDTSGLNSVQGATQNIVNNLKSVEKQAKTTAKSVYDINTTLSSFSFPSGITEKNHKIVVNLEKALQNARDMFSKLGFDNVDLSWADEAGGVFDRITAKVTDAYGVVQNFKFALSESKDLNKSVFSYEGSFGSDSGVAKLTTSIQKAQDKLKALRIDLASTLKSIGTGYSDPNSVKPIVDDTHIKNLNNQYVHALRSIAELKNADNTTMASMKANAEKEIDTLKRMVKEYQNAEYAATSLRTKDIGTVKESQTNDLNKFIAQINSAKIPIQAITNDIETLKTALANVTDKESLTAYLNQFDVVKTKFDSIKVTYNSIADAIKQLTALQNNTVFNKNASNPQVTQTKQEITQLIAEYQKLMTQMQGNITPEGLIDIGNQLTQLNARFNSVTTSANSFEQSLKTDNGAEKFKQKVSILTAQIKEFQKVNTKSLKKYGTDFNRMLKELTNPNLDTQGLERIRVEFQNIKREINTAGLAGKDFFGRIKEQAAKFASWMSLTGVITGAWHEVKKMVTNVIELDNCLLELSKVSDLSATGLKSITKEAYEMGKQVGKTGTDVINAVTNFKRAGFDLKESMSFAKDALVLTNVAEGITDTGEAATALISIMKGYGDTSLEFSQKILDATNEVELLAS